LLEEPGQCVSKQHGGLWRAEKTAAWVGKKKYDQGRKEADVVIREVLEKSRGPVVRKELRHVFEIWGGG